MGEVWEAIAPRTGARVALKVLSRTDARSRGTPDVTFLNEAKFGASLKHPNLVAVSDVGVDGASLYFAMELLEGRPLSSLVGPHAPRLPLPLVVELCRQGLEGLSAVHHHQGPDGQDRHVVHRDVKPSNLFLTDAGVLKVIDFGIARGFDADRTHTRTGVFRGSLPYASPEQASGEPVDERSDLFSFGAVVFELLTGRRLFNQDNEAAIVLAIVNRPAPRVTQLRGDVPEPIADWLAAGLQRDKASRPPTARAWLETLELATRELPRWTEADVAAWLKTVPRDAVTTGTTDLGDLPGARETASAPAIEALPRRRAKMLAGAGVALGVVLAAAASALWPAGEAQPTPGVSPSAPAPVTATSPEPVPSPPVPEAATAPAEPPVTAVKPAPVRSVGPAEPAQKAGRLKVGWVTVDIAPGYGKVRIDGNELGITPLYRAPLPPGRHVVELAREDGRVKQQTVRVVSEKELVLRLRW